MQLDKRGCDPLLSPTALVCVAPLLKRSASTSGSGNVCMSRKLALQLSATYMLMRGCEVNAKQNRKFKTDN